MSADDFSKLEMQYALPFLLTVSDSCVLCGEREREHNDMNVNTVVMLHVRYIVRICDCLGSILFRQEPVAPGIGMLTMNRFSMNH